MNLDDCYTKEELKMKRAAMEFLRSLNQPGTKRTSFALEMAYYVSKYPERAISVGEHQYRDFYAFKQRSMAREMIEGIHKNPLIDRKGVQQNKEASKYGTLGLKKTGTLFL